MNNESALLGLAAKAVGIKLDESRGYPCRVEVEVCADTIIHSIENKLIPWDPLTHEGDRYRLLRAIKGNIYFSGKSGVVEVPSKTGGENIYYTFPFGDDAAEGLAVVSAAADIGRASHG